MTKVYPLIVTLAALAEVLFIIVIVDAAATCDVPDRVETFEDLFWVQFQTENYQDNKIEHETKVKNNINKYYFFFNLVANSYWYLVANSY
jgi:hypothetical protein